MPERMNLKRLVSALGQHAGTARSHYRKLNWYSKASAHFATPILVLTATTIVPSTARDMGHSCTICVHCHSLHRHRTRPDSPDVIRFRAEDQSPARWLADSRGADGYYPSWRIVSTLADHDTVLESFPPFIGHTTTITLCGYAYGMNGFWISAAASLFGSSFAFVMLRYIFSKRLRRWSASNEKWQALQAVAVCSPPSLSL